MKRRTGGEPSGSSGEGLEFNVQSSTFNVRGAWTMMAAGMQARFGPGDQEGSRAGNDMATVIDLVSD